MKRGGAVVAAAAAALLAICALGLSLAGARGARAEAYARDRSAQRRAAVAARPLPPASAALPGAVKGSCVSGVDGFALAVENVLVPLPPATAPRARRVAALRQISDAAVRAEKLAEIARPAPTLPKRMGLVDGQPVAPAKLACDGKGFAELR